MAEIVLGKHFNIGGREVYEDRVQVAEFRTKAGQLLHVALVCDGVGGRDKGERAAQIAMDAVMEYLPNATDLDIPRVLTGAVSLANRRVYEAAQAQGTQGMATTLALAVIADGRTLYIATVGDSRIYLVRNGKLSQLSYDHSYANMMVQRGQMDRAAADAHPKAQVVMRAIGVRETVSVDLGFYVGTIDEETAGERGRKGLPLQQGDAVLVCSDGLIKNSPVSGKPLITEDEIISVLSGEEGDKACRTLVAFALGREPDDNVSAALLQTPDLARRGRATRRRLLVPAIVTLVVLALLCGLAIALLGLRQQQAQLTSVNATETRRAFEETSIAEVLAAFTPTPVPPTATLRPTPIPGEVAALIDRENRNPIVDNQLVNAPAESLLVVNHRSDLNDGNDGRLYALLASTLAFTGVSDDRIDLSLSEGGGLFVVGGRYVGGVNIRLEPSGIALSVSGSCLSVSPAPSDSPGPLRVACYEGSCSVVMRFGDSPVEIPAGQFMVLDVNRFSISDPQKIESNDLLGELTVLRRFGAAGLLDVDRCLTPYLPAPATPTPIIVPTFTGQAPVTGSPDTESTATDPSATAGTAAAETPAGTEAVETPEAPAATP